MLGRLLTFLFALTLLLQAGSPDSTTSNKPSQKPPNSPRGSVASPQVDNTTPNTTSRLTVARVVDGDTIELSTGEKVRYIGIDTPEVVDPRKPVQCFGVEASNANKSLVLGKEVRLEKDVSETDKYGRLLRYIWVGEKLINEELVRRGFAHSSPYPPDIKYQDRFNTAETQARTENLGLWAGCPSGVTQPTNTVGKTPPDPSCTIKGNISQAGKKIYHLPGGAYYDKTVIDTAAGERWFCSEAEAQAAGWQKSKR